MTPEDFRRRLKRVFADALSSSAVVPTKFYKNQFSTLYGQAGFNPVEVGNTSDQFHNVVEGLLAGFNINGLTFKVYWDDTNNDHYLEMWGTPASVYFANKLADDIKLRGEGVLRRVEIQKWLTNVNIDNFAGVLTRIVGDDVVCHEENFGMDYRFDLRMPKISEYREFMDFLRKEIP